MQDFMSLEIKHRSKIDPILVAGSILVGVALGVAEIQELGTNKSYMVDIMDIITSEKEFFKNMVFLWR